MGSNIAFGDYSITRDLLGLPNSGIQPAAPKEQGVGAVFIPPAEAEPHYIARGAKYSPKGIAKRTFINWGSGLKAEDNKGVNPKGARNSDICLAKCAQRVAENMDTVGQCYTGAKYALWDAGVIDHYDDMPKGEARDSIAYFDSHPERFRRADVAPEDVKSLPAGRILVYQNEEQDVPGHIAITNGNGQGMSDFTDNLGWIDKHGEGSTVNVYELTDGWHQDFTTGQLRFSE